MGLKSDIESEVKEILDWNIEITEEKSAVPTKDDLSLGETAIKLTTCVLYVDIRGSSKLADNHRSTTAAKVYNAYLNAMVRVARSNYGRVRSFNGDSILVIFDPNQPDTIRDWAVRAAMKMQWVASNIIEPAVKAKKYENEFRVGIGVTHGTLLVTKAGIRGLDNNDLIWPCTPVNLAAKLGDSASDPYHIYISKEVYDGLSSDRRFVQRDGKSVNIWEKDSAFDFAGDKVTVYKTEWYTAIS